MTTTIPKKVEEEEDDDDQEEEVRFSILSFVSLAFGRRRRF